MKKDIRLYFFVAFIILAILACSSNNTGNNDGDTDTITGELVFEDNFSDEDSGWDKITETDYVIDYQDGSYIMGIYQTEYISVSIFGNIFSDVIIEVDTTFSSGEYDNYFGVVCRYEDFDNFYALVITTDGYYGIVKFRGDDIGMVGTDSFLESDAIRQGESENHIRAECIGDRFALYVNGELLAEEYDADAPDGDIGMFVGTFSAETTQILFDNIKIYEP